MNPLLEDIGNWFASSGWNSLVFYFLLGGFVVTSLYIVRILLNWFLKTSKLNHQITELKESLNTLEIKLDHIQDSLDEFNKSNFEEVKASNFNSEQKELPLQ